MTVAAAGASWMGPVAVGLTAFSMIRGLGAAKQGKIAAQRDAELRQRAAQFDAKVLEQRAGQAFASAQRSAMDVQRMATLAESRALAVAAASGGGASSPTVVNVIGDLAKEGAYRSGIEFYKGMEAKQNLEMQADMRLWEGETGLQTARAKGEIMDAAAESNIISGAAGLFTKYGAGGPDKIGMVEESVPGQFSSADPRYG